MTTETEFENLRESWYGKPEGSIAPENNAEEADETNEVDSENDSNDYEDEEVSEDSEEVEDLEDEEFENQKKYKLKLKIDGKVVEEELDEETIVNSVQKSKNYDREMSLLDRERKAFLKDKEDFLGYMKSQESLIDKGKFLSEAEQADPNIKKRLLGVQGSKSEVEADLDQDRYNKLLEMADSEEYKEVPIIKALAEQVSFLSKRFDSDRKKLEEQLGKTSQGVLSIQEEKRIAQEDAVRVQTANKVKALEVWGNENGITFDVNDKRMSHLRFAMQNGEDLIETAEMLYSKEIKPKAKEPAPSVERKTMATEERPVSIKRVKGKALSSEMQDLKNRWYGS